MKFVDEVIVDVRSGNGGKGCVSFRREKFIPRGGPDGGDGGRGGHVVLKTSSGMRTLYRFRHNRFLKAKNGVHGQGKNKTGKQGDDLVVEIPAGTIVSNAETGQIIKDFTEAGESIIIATGGRGGQGNAKFKSSRHRSPRFAQDGEPGEGFILKFELKLLADVGIVGLPNAGKSTLISMVSSARPKIGSYPFTTLTPNLGMLYAEFGEPVVFADIPGLIEGAHTGTGLGISFLKHIERTRILIHLIDASDVDITDSGTLDIKKILSAYNTVCTELARYSKKLEGKYQIIALNKMDLPLAKESAEIFRKAIPDKKVSLISAATREGVDDLIAATIKALEYVNE